MQEIIPVLLGADLNCYSVARAFHEAYGVVSHAFGKCELGPIKNSKIIEFKKIPSLTHGDEILKILIDFSSALNVKPFLVGCTDEYALFIIKNQKKLSEHYVCRVPSEEIIPVLSDKTEFYKLCDSISVSYPEYIGIGADDFDGKLDLSYLGYPVIVKPACSSEYWYHEFDGMKKVYTAYSNEEALGVIGEIYASGYGDDIVIQRKIFGGPSYVATAYSKNGTVKAMCIGRVVLGENTPKGIGNHVAIFTEYNEKIYFEVSRVLEKIKYTGMSNFDIVSDCDGKIYLLEINPRQGRSNYYMTAAGMNIAKLIVEEEYVGKMICDNNVFWHCVPKDIIMRFCNDSDKNEIKNLTKYGKSFSTLSYEYDTKSLSRAFYIAAHNIGFYKKYRSYANEK